MFPGNKNPNCFHLKCGLKFFNFIRQKLHILGSGDKSKDFVRAHISKQKKILMCPFLSKVKKNIKEAHIRKESYIVLNYLQY